LAFLLGIRGSKERAFQRLELVAEKGKYRQLDAQILLAVLHAWKGDPGEAAMIFERLRKRYPENYLFDINLAAIYELQLNNPKAALLIYQELRESLQTKAHGLREGELHYRTGRTYLRLHDYSLALQAFEKALTTPKGEQETEPLTHFSMARIHEERGAEEEARKHYQKVLTYSGPKDGLVNEIKRARRKLR